MAEIVLGIGSSHGPLLSTPPEQWDMRAQADRENKKHWYRGKTYDYETLLRERAPGFAEEVTVESRQERFAQCHRAMEVLTQKFKETAPEAVVIVGNDQREFFDEGLTPAITVYRGAQIKNLQHLPANNPPGINIAEPGNSPEEGASYPGATALADHILDSLAAEEFRSRAIGLHAQSGAARGHSARVRVPVSFHPRRHAAAQRPDYSECSLSAQRAEEPPLPGSGHRTASRDQELRWVSDAWL